MEIVRPLRPDTAEPPGSELWFDRIDAEAHRGFHPVVTVPRSTDRQLGDLADRFDRLLQLPLTGTVLATSGPTLARGLVDPSRLLDEWAFYLQPEFLTDPDTFFVRPPEGIVPARGRVGHTTFRPRGGRVADYWFASPFEPVNPRMRGGFLQRGRNRHAHLRLWRHGDRPRPVSVCFHGMMAGHKTLNTELFNVRWLYERGMDVALFDLPHHGFRSGPVHGLGFPSLDIAQLAENWANAVYDFRIFLDWLYAQGAPEVGVMGVSLGGYMTSLVAALEEDLAFAVPMIPATSLGDCAVGWFPARQLLGLMFARLGWTLDDMRAHTAVHTPLQHPVHLPLERLMIIAADHDNVTPPHQSRLLWEHWGGPQVHWYAGSHAIHVHRGTYLRQLGRFLGGLGMFDAS